QGSGGVAGGAAIAVNVVETETKVETFGLLTRLNESGQMSLSARSEQDLVTVAVGGAGGGAFALGGSVAVTTLDGATAVLAHLPKDKTWSVHDLSLTATDRSMVTSVAGGVGVG